MDGLVPHLIHPAPNEEAMFIDEKNSNRKWQDSEDLEINQIDEYKTLNDLGKNAPIPEGHTKIP